MDKILKETFKKERWNKAINKGVLKDINKTLLRDLTSPKTRLAMYAAIKNGTYRILPPHEALIPKPDSDEMRHVWVNEPRDRVLLSIVNDTLFELCSDMVHPRCKSYQTGIGCGKVVREASKYMVSLNTKTVGLKADLTKYFDSVKVEYIDKVFDKVEEKLGHSAVIDCLRDFYHTDLAFDVDNNLITHYKSLAQGCAVASFLADAILYDLDDYFSKELPFYVRYSDDILMITDNPQKWHSVLEEKLKDYGLGLNPKKVEYLTTDTYFKFLGFSLRGSQITLSSSRIKKFQKEIERLTWKDRKNTPTKALNKVQRFLYKGYGIENYSWATSVLSVINVQEDIDTLNQFVMDCLRAVETKKTKLGGLGYEPCKNKKVGCITRGTGKNVTSNRAKTSKCIGNYKSLRCMQKALLSDKDVFVALVSQM